MQLVEELLPIFDDQSSQMRKLSISLFRDMVGNDQRRMKKKVQSGLLPFVFHTRGETDSVAQVEMPKLV
ncbi:maestro heat-like repeat-containing protein family member 7 [Grus japonensis]|uniref:Maestro heat-like repeat-containing protein family member 7 n=1 Tax=Grus japonensis TaxID=30415 RepID=A0ABC9Y843_GRUJA